MDEMMEKRRDRLRVLLQMRSLLGLQYETQVYRHHMDTRCMYKFRKKNGRTERTSSAWMTGTYGQRMDRRKNDCCERKNALVMSWPMRMRTRT